MRTKELLRDGNGSSIHFPFLIESSFSEKLFIPISIKNLEKNRASLRGPFQWIIVSSTRTIRFWADTGSWVKNVSKMRMFYSFCLVPKKPLRVRRMRKKIPYISSFTYCSKYWETNSLFSTILSFRSYATPFQSCHKMRRIKTNLYFKHTKSEEMRKCTDFKIWLKACDTITNSIWRISESVKITRSMKLIEHEKKGGSQ